MQTNAKAKLTAREKRIVSLAVSINKMMREHADRNEAIDGYDMARVLFRKGTNEKGFIHRSSLSLPTAP